MKKKMWWAPVVAGLVLLGAALTAQATPVTWTLNNVTFDDGGAASGWITYDSADPHASLFNVTLTAGSLQTAFTFHKAQISVAALGDNSFLDYPGFGPNNFFLWEIGSADPRNFNFSFASPLTDAGGTHDLLTASSYDCKNNECDKARMVTGGSLTTLVTGPGPNGVPEPATLGLMLPALGMLGWMARRRKQKAA